MFFIPLKQEKNIDRQIQRMETYTEKYKEEIVEQG